MASNKLDLLTLQMARTIHKSAKSKAAQIMNLQLQQLSASNRRPQRKEEKFPRQTASSQGICHYLQTTKSLGEKYCPKLK